MQTDTKQHHNTATDSLFGMMLATAFVGAVFGPLAETAFKAADTASSIYEDRRPAFQLGVKNSLSGTFARETQDWKNIMQPLQAMRPSTPSFAF